jgi:hypothetical protein
MKKSCKGFFIYFFQDVAQWGVCFDAKMLYDRVLHTRPKNPVVSKSRNRDCDFGHDVTMHSIVE